MLGNLAVIAACLIAAWSLQRVSETARSIPRIDFAAGQNTLAEPPAAGEPLNFLLVGSDSAARLDENNPVTAGRDLESEAKRSRADTIMLVRLDPETGRAAILSIPRDLWVPIPGFKEEKINAALSRGGPSLLVETVTSYFDVDIHHYMQVDFAGFAAVVDTIGGVPIYFQNPARDRSSGLSIPEAGCVSLTGSEALGYVRSRKYQEFIDGQWVSVDSRTDLDRGARQRDFMILALDQVVSRTGRNPLEIERLVSAVTDDGSSISIDDELSIRDLLNIGTAFREFDPDSLARYELPVKFDSVETGAAPAPRQQDTAESGETGEAGDTAEVAEPEIPRIEILRLMPQTAQPVLDVFRGLAPGDVHPADIKIIVAQGSGEPQQVADAVDSLRARGFDVVNSGQVEADSETVIRFTNDSQASAELLARYLGSLPGVGLKSGESASIELVVGADYNTVRLLPRPPAEISELFVSVPDVSTTLPAVPGETGETSETGDAGAPETTVSTTTLPPSPATTDGPSEALSTTTTSEVVRGQVPSGTACE